MPEVVADTVTVVWSVDKPELAEITQSGYLSAILKGSVTVTATAAGKSASCIVNITEVAITEFKLASSMSCNIFNPAKVSLSYAPEYANPANMTISLSPSDGISYEFINKELYVTSTKPGTYTLSVGYGNLATQTCTIKSSLKAITKVSAPEKANMSVGTSKQWSVDVTPSDASYANVVEWSSSNTDVATVSADGTVNAIAVGQAVISAVVGKNENGEKTWPVQTTLTVSVTPPVENFTLIPSSQTLSLGGSYTFGVIDVKPEGADAATLSWKSSNTDLVTVDQYGKVTATTENKTGTVTITAYQGDVSRTATVTVKKVDVKSISFSESSIGAYAGNTYYLPLPVVEPADASFGTISYTYSDGLTVSEVNGKLRITVKGDATLFTKHSVTATADGKSATLSVSVCSPNSSVMSTVVNTEKIQGVFSYSASFSGTEATLSQYSTVMAAFSPKIQFKKDFSSNDAVVGDEEYLANKDYSSIKLWFKNVTSDTDANITFNYIIKDYNGKELSTAFSKSFRSAALTAYNYKSIYVIETCANNRMVDPPSGATTPGSTIKLDQKKKSYGYVWLYHGITITGASSIGTFDLVKDDSSVCTMSGTKTYTVGISKVGTINFNLNVKNNLDD